MTICEEGAVAMEGMSESRIRTEHVQTEGGGSIVGGGHHAQRPVELGMGE